MINKGNSGIKWQEMKQNLTLVITGSVAAVKTGQMIRALEERGFSLSFLVTPSARPFLKINKKYNLDSATRRKLQAGLVTLQQMPIGPLLIAPATAETIALLALGQGFGKILHDRARPLFIAPAMNVMMWHHPAVQENIHTLSCGRTIFLGPVSGGMACGDKGYGRMAEPQEIAEALKRHLSGTKHKLSQAVRGAAARPKKLPRPDIHELPASMLLFADDGKTAGPLEKKLKKNGFALKTIGRRFRHYQEDPQGMEHIRLPENAGTLLFAGLTSGIAREMAQGRAQTFAACLYLASKAPVVIVPSSSDPPQRRDLTTLAGRGACILRKRQAATLIPRRRILVLGGQVRENVDSFRFYAATARSQDHGRKAAAILTRNGNKVTLIETCGSTDDLLHAARQAASTNSFDTVLQLAQIPPVICPAPVGHKIAKTGPEKGLLFRVRGNVDIRQELENIFPGATVAGYDTRQQWFGPAAARKWVQHPRPPKTRNARKPSGQHRIIVTTGPTREPLDATGTAITNAFTGRQGQEIAKELARMGFDVTLVSGPCAAAHPKNPRIAVISVTTYAQMRSAVTSLLRQSPLAYVSAAAIADFSMKKSFLPDIRPGVERRLHLKENASLVGEVARHALRPPVVVSFAAQSPRDLLRYAAEKFKKLGVDMTVANPIGSRRDPLRNKICLITQAGIQKFPDMPKAETGKIIARAIIYLLSKIRSAN